MNHKTNLFIALDVHDRMTQYAVRTLRGDIILDGSCSTTYPDVKGALSIISILVL